MHIHHTQVRVYRHDVPCALLWLGPQQQLGSECQPTAYSLQTIVRPLSWAAFRADPPFSCTLIPLTPRHHSEDYDCDGDYGPCAIPSRMMLPCLRPPHKQPHGRTMTYTPLRSSLIPFSLDIHAFPNPFARSSASASSSPRLSRFPGSFALALRSCALTVRPFPARSFASSSSFRPPPSLSVHSYAPHAEHALLLADVDDMATTSFRTPILCTYIHLLYRSSVGSLTLAVRLLPLSPSLSSLLSS